MTAGRTSSLFHFVHTWSGTYVYIFDTKYSVNRSSRGIQWTINQDIWGKLYCRRIWLTRIRFERYFQCRNIFTGESSAISISRILWRILSNTLQEQVMHRQIVIIPRQHTKKSNNQPGWIWNPSSRIVTFKSTPRYLTSNRSNKLSPRNERHRCQFRSRATKKLNKRPGAPVLLHRACRCLWSTLTLPEHMRRNQNQIHRGVTRTQTHRHMNTARRIHTHGTRVRARAAAARADHVAKQ